MISYKYKLYRNKRTKHLDAMLSEASFVWNHALALQKRYYRLYGKYINCGRLKAHFAHHIKRNLLYAQTVQEILERLDASYRRFFTHSARRTPKFRRASNFPSIVFKQGGYSLNGNVLTVNSIGKRFKFSLSRPYSGKIKTLTIKRNRLGEYFIIMTFDKSPISLGKTHNGASVGIDFGLKRYMTLSDGTMIDSPQFLRENLSELRRKSRNLSKCVKGSNNFERKRLELVRLYEHIHNMRNDFQWKLAHALCRKYDTIFIEDLVLEGMRRRWGRKMIDLAHGNFVLKLQYVATKYDVVVHKIGRYFASSRMCTCGKVNEKLRLSERYWTCSVCGKKHDRDLLAANNIYRQGIADLASDGKSSQLTTGGRSRLQPRIPSFWDREYTKDDLVRQRFDLSLPKNP